MRLAGSWGREEHVVQFILAMIDRGLSRVTIAGKLSAIAFMGKLWWGYVPFAGELGTSILEGWAREHGAVSRVREPISCALLQDMVRLLPWVCLNGEESMIFATLMSWMYFGAFRVSELFGTRGAPGVQWEDVSFQGSWVVLGPSVAAAGSPATLGITLGRVQGKAAGQVFCRRDGRRVTGPQLLWVMRRVLRVLGERPHRLELIRSALGQRRTRHEEGGAGSV